MKTSVANSWLIINMVLLILLPAAATAQPGKIPFHREPYFMDSGMHDGQTGPEAAIFVAFREVIQAPGAPWLRLHFS